MIDILCDGRTARALRRALVVLPIALAACAEPEPVADLPSATAAMEAMKATVLDGVVRKDPAAIASLYADDAVVHDLDGALITGRAAIQDRIAAVLPLVQAYAINSQRFEEAGGLAYDQQIFQLTLSAGEGGVPRMLTGHQIVILKRQPDQSWKVVQSGTWITPGEMHH